MLIDDEAVGEPEPGARRTLPAIIAEPSSPEAIMCSLRMLAPALVPPTVTPWALRIADQLRDRRAAEQRREPQLIAAGEEDAGGLLEALEAPGFLAVAAGVEVHDRDARGADVAEQLLVARPGLVHAAGGGDHDDVGVLAPGDAHEALEDAAVIFLILGAADRNDPAALSVLELCWASVTTPGAKAPLLSQKYHARAPRGDGALLDPVQQLECQPPLERAHLVGGKPPTRSWK